MDKSYCIIRISKHLYSLNIELIMYICDSISYELSSKKLHYPVCFRANKASDIIDLMIYLSDLELLSSSHLLYIGQELCKAEISLLTSQCYIQN